MLFQLMFAIITPALITGAFAERMSFGAFVLFTDAVVHARLRPGLPLGVGEGRMARHARRHQSARLRRRHGGAHQLRRRGAGGRARDGTRGVGHPKEPMLPNNLGAHACSAPASSGSVGSASTPAARSPRAGSRPRLSWRRTSPPPPRRSPGASPSTSPAARRASSERRPARSRAWSPSLRLPVSSGRWRRSSSARSSACSATGRSNLKTKLGYDDSLDAFGVHGVGGTWGAIATGLFASTAVNSAGGDGLLLREPRAAAACRS